MSVVNFSIGSFGDIASLLQLAWAVRTVLNEAATATADIRQLVDDMDTFSKSLEQVKSLIQRRGELLDTEVCNGIAHALSMCEVVLRAVEAQMASYRRGLMRKHGAAWRKYWTMVAWSALGGKKSADALKLRLFEQMNVINTYLSLSQSNDQSRLLDTVTQQGTTLTRVYDVVTDISKRFDFGVPSFHFRDPFDDKYYLPMGRTSLHKLAELYEMFSGERTTPVDFPGEKMHRVLLIPIGIRYQATVGDPPFAMVDCFLFRDPAFGQPQVLMSTPWLVHRREHFGGAYTPFYEHIRNGYCTMCTSDQLVHFHLKPSDQAFSREESCFSEFWGNQRSEPLTMALSFSNGRRDSESRASLIDNLKELDDHARGIVEILCRGDYPKPEEAAYLNVCFPISPIVKLRQMDDCRVLPRALKDHDTAVLRQDLVRRIDKHSKLFDAEKDYELLWLCWAEELRRAVLMPPS